MYRIKGTELSQLFVRTFLKSDPAQGHSIILPDVLACHSTHIGINQFDLLHFRGSFAESVCIKEFQDTSHISLHLQLWGHSDAHISGLSDEIPMNQGEYNLVHCVDPTSTFLFPKQKRYEYFCIGIKPVFLEQLLLEAGHGHSDLLSKIQGPYSFKFFKKNRSITSVLQSVFHSVCTPPPVGNLVGAYLQAKVSEAIITVIGQEVPPKDPSRETCNDQEKLMAVRQFLDVSFLKDLTLSQIAKDCLLNEFMLKKGFKERFGITVFGYIHRLRMQHAYELLLSGGLSIGQIADITGYSSHAAFTRAFTNYFKCAPGKLIANGKV